MRGVDFKSDFRFLDLAGIYFALGERHVFSGSGKGGLVLAEVGSKEQTGNVRTKLIHNDSCFSQEATDDKN